MNEQIEIIIVYLIGVLSCSAIAVARLRREGDDYVGLCLAFFALVPLANLLLAVLLGFAGLLRMMARKV